jgi:type I restriction enzyme, R subunit
MSYEYSEDKLIESTAIKLFLDLGWDTIVAYNKEGYGEGSQLGRKNRSEVVLRRAFMEKIRAFNPNLSEKIYNDAYEILISYSNTKTLAEINFEKYKMLRDGIEVVYTEEKGGATKTKRLKVFDFKNVENNHFLAVQQLWIEGKSRRERRPDIIGYVNGIPLLFIELKNPTKNLREAYDKNFTDYKDTIPTLFHHNAFVILSNGLESKIGSITAKYEYFHEWKRISEQEEGKIGLDRIIIGVCEKQRFMDLFEHFILFDNTASLVKIIARNHQFIGVNDAINNIKINQTAFEKGEINQEAKQKLGVFWHTQGSGKSYSMVFFCQKIHRSFSGSYTFLIVTDRTELENQIYGTFDSIGAWSGEKSGNHKDSTIKASSGKHLKELLSAEHRYLFSLIHKFNFSEVITQRDNIIVISDEAHRTQGGNLAMNLRKAIPNASFIGFTGTPLLKDDEITKRIFGKYVSRYDFKRSVEDNATVPLYYENRGEHLGLTNPNINAEIRAVIDDEEENLDSDQRAKLNQLFAREYPILTAKKRLDTIAKDVVQHFCTRGYKGKAMFIALDKLTAVKMYDLLVKHWAEYVAVLEKNLKKGNHGDQEHLELERELQWIKETEICVVVSSEQNEIQKFKQWELDIEPHREKMNTQDLEVRFKDENDHFRLVIVCAMWITGFDVPTLSTLYLDKPLKSHTLMQAIARANRTSTGKNNGLIVDYIETYTALLDALSDYGSSDAKTAKENDAPNEPPVKQKAELVAMLEEAIEAMETFLKDELDFDLQTIITQENLDKLVAIGAGIEAIYRNDTTKATFKILANTVFTKYKSLQPDKVLYNYADKKNAIEALHNKIENNETSADVSDIMQRIQHIIDGSIDNSLVAEPNLNESTIIDLSGINFEALEKLFEKTPNKNSMVQSLKQKIEQRLKQMLERNPTTIDFYNRYQQIIADYNLGKDEVIIKETFRQLIALVNSFSQQEAEAKREGLNEEQTAIFDILRQGKTLNKEEKENVKRLAIALLADLKQEPLQVEMWYEKSTTTAVVFNTISSSLYNQLPYPTYQNDDIDLKTNIVFAHLRSQYFGGGVSIYGAY